jgi:Domain of unknown function (DUF4864)
MPPHHAYRFLSDVRQKDLLAKTAPFRVFLQCQTPLCRAAARNLSAIGMFFCAVPKIALALALALIFWSGYAPQVQAAPPLFLAAKADAGLKTGAALKASVHKIQATSPKGEEVSDDDQAAIADIVKQQLAAFARDDAVGAFAFAAPNIQAMFTTPAEFFAMVKQGYAPVYRHKNVSFLPVLKIADQLVQPVILVDMQDKLVHAVYFMEKIADGSWRIAGCNLLKAPGVEL